jgi:hypothetical protein
VRKLATGKSEEHHHYQLYKISSNILLSRLSYIDKIIWDHQCGIQHQQSTTDQIFCIHQTLERKWEYNRWYISYLRSSRKPVIPLDEKYSIYQ